ncbi:MAG TPA: shikimate kinase [Pyrinomonadaceae bacterium]|nr:shikimate kinase [Pyrinomonadaceae bacterium]
MKLVITGFMGCGKTQVARELARRLNLEMVDLDEAIIKREGRSPAQLIVEDGEEAFRAIESDVLRSLLETGGEGVIALGGGAWIQEINRELIRQYNWVSVWLAAPFEICWARIEASEDDRPLGKTREQAQALFDRRRPIYELADVHIHVHAADGLADIVDRITGFAGLNPANPETS